MAGSDDAKRRTTRARGEGSIWRNKKTGQWFYAVSINGKQRKYRAPDKQTAAARLKQLKEELDHGVTPGRQRPLGVHCQECMEKVFMLLKLKTQRSYRQTIEHYLLPYLGERTPMKKVGPEDIVDMLNGMRRAGYADNTIKQAYTVGKRIFNLGHQWGRILFNPFDRVDPPTVEKVEKVPLTLAELLALRHALRSHRLIALYEIGWTLGLRLGELLGLTIAGLDLKAGTMTIAQQVLDVKGGPSIEPYTKNNRVRTLPLTPRLIALIRVRLAQLLQERGRDDWVEKGLLFPSERGTPMSERNFERQFDARCVAAQIRLRDTGKRTKKEKPIYASDLHPHLLRHTALSWLGDTGASDMVIKAIAGHADRDVTDRYVHVSIEAMREALLRMEAAKLLPTDDGSADSNQAEVG